MASLKFVIVLACLVASVLAYPTPGGSGHHGGHYIIHVPFKIHTIHHHSVKKVPIYHHYEHNDHHFHHHHIPEDHHDDHEEYFGGGGHY